MIEDAIRTYVAAWNEPDAAARERLLEACFASDGRFVTGGAASVGRAALAARMAAFHTKPGAGTARFTSAIDVQGRMFRFSGALERDDGTVLGKSFDAGEVDADGRIAVLLTFVDR